MIHMKQRHSRMVKMKRESNVNYTHKLKRDLYHTSIATPVKNLRMANPTYDGMKDVVRHRMKMEIWETIWTGFLPNLSEITVHKNPPSPCPKSMRDCERSTFVDSPQRSPH